jgi:hypothetical protein
VQRELPEDAVCIDILKLIFISAQLPQVPGNSILVQLK